MLAKKYDNVMNISMAAIVFATALALALAAPIFAQSTPQVSFKEIYLLGKGIAVNPTNNQDLSIVTIGLAKVTVNVAGTNTDVVAGVLHFGSDQTYKVKNANVGNGTISGDLYLNSSQVGSFSFTLVSKPSDNIWAGTITISGQTWNAYILEAHQQYSSSEEKQTIADYCANHQDDENCRNKVEDFCQNNPNDARCISLLHNYCKSNLQDGRCREALRDFCQKNASDSNCVGFCEKYPRVCGSSTATTTTLTTSSVTTTSATTTTPSVTTTTSASSATSTTTTTPATSTTTSATTSPTTTTTAASTGQTTTTTHGG